MLSRHVLCASGIIAIAVATPPSIVRADVFNLPSGQTSLQFVTVGDPGNAPDTLVEDDLSTGHGSVPYTYQIGKFDVTSAQYTQFLNAVATVADPYGLYNGSMAVETAPNTSPAECGINQVRIGGAFSYNVDSMHANMPVNNVTYADAARFCNWLSNGQPVGQEKNSLYAFVRGPVQFLHALQPTA